MNTFSVLVIAPRSLYSSFLTTLLVVLLSFGYGKGQQVNLPEVLLNEKGQKVRTAEAWQKERRPEILSLFENHVYGKMPKDFDQIQYIPEGTVERAMGGKALLKKVAIEVSRNQQSVTLHLVMFIPANATTPPPVFLLINHRTKENTDPTRAARMDFWPAEQVIERGYAIAAFNVSDVAPDNKDTYASEVMRLYPEHLHQPNGMKAIGAWAWGASRVMDYLQTDRSINSARVAVLGHSRGGKAALWCGAQDERFALTISNDSGCTGAALARRPVGEDVARINKQFPYWFSNKYQDYNGRETELPVDQHMLIALMAPRAVYVASASDDTWADPVGEFLAVKYAEPVFRLFGLKPLPVKEQPAIESPVRSSHLGYHLRRGGHGLELYDWQRFMDFADVHYTATTN
jgi:hypothetical protein